MRCSVIIRPPSTSSSITKGHKRIAGIFKADDIQGILRHKGYVKALQEAGIIARVQDVPGVVRVFDCFTRNNTVYIIMEFIEGETFAEYAAKKGPLKWQELWRRIRPVGVALGRLHRLNLVHRDISPDNIMIRKDGDAKLIDFGAARYSTGEKSKSLDVVLKHGFAPMEQYSRRGRQGPFTDVYAMAATYYYAITGKVPPDAVDRMSEDELQLPSEFGVNIREDTEQVRSILSVRV